VPYGSSFSGADVARLLDDSFDIIKSGISQYHIRHLFIIQYQVATKLFNKS